jgi:putative salt-induced outer membrane protein YdiY
MRAMTRLLLSLASPGLLTGSMASADTFELSNGDKVTGEVLERTADRIVLEHPVFGRIVVPTSELKPAERVNPGLFGTGLMEGWKREFALGVNGSDGNTVNFNLRSTLDFDYEDERRRWEIGGVFVYKSEDSEATDQFGKASIRRDWLFPGSRWFVFGAGVWDYDDFKDWKHRVGVVSGPGYEILKRETTTLRSAVGLSFQRELKGEKDNLLGGYWGVDFNWDINSILRFRARNNLFPYFNESGEWRNVSSLALRVRLLEAPVLNLNLGIDNEYDSNAVPEDDKNDLKYSTTIGLEF